MTKNLIGKIGVGVALVGALAGTAYGGNKEDLDAVRGYVMKHPTRVSEVSINGGPKFKSYRVQKNGSEVETNKYGTLFKRIVNGKMTYACDHRNDGELDRILILRGDHVSAKDDAFARMECSGEGSLDTELSLSDTVQWGEGKTPYNTRAVMVVNEDAAYDFNKGIKIPLKKTKEFAKKIYENSLKTTQKAFK